MINLSWEWVIVLLLSVFMFVWIQFKYVSTLEEPGHNPNGVAVLWYSVVWALGTGFSILMFILSIQRIVIHQIGLP